MKSKFILPLVIISLLVQQCAKQTSPTGGPKDETPPKLVESNPANKETLFKKEKIELTFDEHIQLNNPREQIIITPTIGKKFEVTAKKNKATLVLNSPLKDSTTYNINFRECIQDLNEKNPVTVKLAFSTGDYIDSLSISGSVKDILTDTDVKNYTVALTTSSDTFNIFKHQASWITQTNTNGKFVIENLKQGDYFIYAFDDKNKNLIVDSKNEKYGFFKNTIKLNTLSDSIKLQVYRLDKSALKLISSKPIFNYYSIKLSKSVSTYSFQPVESKERIYSALEPDNSSIKVYNTLQQKADSLQMRLIVYDSAESKIDTLVYLKFNQKPSTKENIQANIEYTRYLESKASLQSVISFTKPIPIINKDSIFIQLDSLTKITFTEEDFEWNQYLTRLTLNKKYKLVPVLNQEVIKPVADQPQAESQKTYNQLTFPKGTFISAELDTIATLTQPVRKISLQETGVILTQIETKEEFIIQLVGRNNEVIEEAKNIKNHKFENLPPALYSIRLIIDLNKNGRWDPGNILTKTDPEPVLYYKNSKKEKEVNLKANWEVGPLLIGY